MKLSDFSVKRSEIFAIHGKEEKDIKEDVRILREWMNKVPHLPANEIEDEYLELCLLRNKLSIEKCKKKIERYFSLKADPHYEYLYDMDKIPIPSKEIVFRCIFPDLTDDNKRIIVNVVDEELYDMTKDASAYIIMSEFLQRHDYNDGEIHITDMSRCSPKVVSKLRVNVVADALQVVVKACSARIYEFHIITNLEKIIRPIMNALLPEKIASRMRFHKDFESLRNALPLKYLPKDFGGDLKPLKEYVDDWTALFEENQEYLRKLVKIKTREELRIKDDTSKEEIQGTFKKLCID